MSSDVLDGNIYLPVSQQEVELNSEDKISGVSSSYNFSNDVRYVEIDDSYSDDQNLIKIDMTDLCAKLVRERIKRLLNQ